MKIKLHKHVVVNLIGFVKKILKIPSQSLGAVALLQSSQNANSLPHPVSAKAIRKPKNPICEEIASRFLVAAENGDTITLRELLDIDASLPKTARAPEEGLMPGHWAPGATALSLAASRGRTLAVALLLPHSDVNISDVHGCTALMFASRYGHSECVKTLLTRNATEQAEKTDQMGRTALIWAAGRFSLPCLRELLPLSDASHKAGDGRTALMIAAMCGHADFVKALLPHTDAQEKDDEGCKALDFAISNEKCECVDVLGSCEPMEHVRETLAQILLENDNLSEESFPRMKAVIEKSELQEALRFGAQAPPGEPDMAHIRPHGGATPRRL